MDGRGTYFNGSLSVSPFAALNDFPFSTGFPFSMYRVHLHLFHSTERILVVKRIVCIEKRRGSVMCVQPDSHFCSQMSFAVKLK